MFAAMFAYFYLKKENVPGAWPLSTFSAGSVSCNDSYNIVTFAVITGTNMKLDKVKFQLVSENHITIPLKMKNVSFDGFTDEKLNDDPVYQVYFYDNETGFTKIGWVDAGDWFKVKAPGDGDYKINGMAYSTSIWEIRGLHF